MKENENVTIEHIQGELYLSNGKKASFTLDEGGFVQWGLDKEELGFTQSVLDALSKAFAEETFLQKELCLD